MAHFDSVSATFSKLEKELSEFEKECVRETHKIAETLLGALFSFTPVWSGETVRNYAAAVGRKPGGGTKSPIGDPGPYASEIARPANEAAARGDLKAALINKELKDIFFTNLVRPDKWELIESGNAPEPGRSRYPGGVSMRAVQVTRAAHAGTVK